MTDSSAAPATDIEAPPDNEVISGVQLEIPATNKQGDYIVYSANSNPVTLNISPKIGGDGVTVHIMFELEGRIIEEIKVPYNLNNVDWQDRRNIAFLGFKQIEDGQNEKREIDTKEMPLLFVTGFLPEESDEIKHQSPTFTLTPSVEDNDTNIKASFSFNTKIFIGDREKSPDLENSSGLLVDIASGTLGDHLIGGLDDLGRHTFKMKATANNGTIGIDLSFDLTAAKIVADPKADFVKADDDALRRGNKAYLIFENFKNKDKIIDAEIATRPDANAKINFSFLLVDSIMIGSANKLHGGSGKLIGGANKLHGGSNDLPRG